jgi:DNA-binding CsgD family transcriptional regulator
MSEYRFEDSIARNPRGHPCAEEGCTKITTGRLCRRHHDQAYHRHYHGTSDGIQTGSKPKLSPEQLAEIRKMRAGFKTIREIALHFKVSTQTISTALRKARP